MDFGIILRKKLANTLKAHHKAQHGNHWIRAPYYWDDGFDACVGH